MKRSLLLSLRGKHPGRLLLVLVFLSATLTTRSQVSVIDYTTAGLTNMLDVFSNQPSIGGFTHSTISSTPTGWDFIPTRVGTYSAQNLPPEYIKNSLYLASSLVSVQDCDVCTLYSFVAIDAYQIGYTFLPDYTYSISMNISGIIPLASPDQFVGVGMSVGTPQFTRDPNQAGIVQAALNAGFSLNSTTLSDYYLDDDFLTNMVYERYYPIYYTGSVPNVYNITMPSFTAPSAATGLNIESLPNLGYTGMNLVINSITITATPNITPAVHFVCSSQSYSTPSPLPTTWTVSPAGVVTLTPNGNGVIATKSSNGFATLTATIPGGISSSFDIATLPTSSISSTSIGSCNGSYQTWYLSATANDPGAYNWHWTVNSSTSGSFYIYNPTSPTTYVDVSGGGSISLTYTDACGETSALNGVTLYSSCGHHFAASVFPNPAVVGSSVTVSTQPAATAAITGKTSAAQPTASSAIYEIKIVDQTGITRKSEKYSTHVPSARVSLNGLRPGMYFLFVFDGTNWTSQKLIVQ